VRKQYHFWPSDGGFDAWDVDRLVALTEGLPVEDVPVAELPEVDSVYWFNGTERPTVRRVVQHFQLMRDVDPGYPIILGPGNRVMDGMHRVARALVEGRDRVKAVRLPTLPPPDFTNCEPEDLPNGDPAD
jgi:hypothetical protein